MTRMGNSISPWGYPLPEAPHPQPLA